EPVPRSASFHAVPLPVSSELDTTPKPLNTYANSSFALSGNSNQPRSGVPSTLNVTSRVELSSRSLSLPSSVTEPSSYQAYTLSSEFLRVMLTIQISTFSLWIKASYRSSETLEMLFTNSTSISVSKELEVPTAPSFV